jgi:hypothetical protein
MLMKKIACIALLVAVSLAAQNAPTPTETPLRQRESAPKNQPKPPAERTVVRELPLNEIRKGYFDDFRGPIPRVQIYSSLPPTGCAIPLITVPAPDNNNFAIRTSPANPSIDPKIVFAPLLPTCMTSVVPQADKPVEHSLKPAEQALKPSEPAAEKK